MNFSIKRVKALTIKEVKIVAKNSNVLLMSLLAILFSIIYSYIYGGNSEVPKDDILLLCLNMNMVMSGIFVIAMLIAQEKEKFTLRTLLLSGVSAAEFLTGKALVTLIIAEITNAVLFFIVGMQVQYLGWYLLFTTLVIISMLIIGAIIGMLSPTQMSTGVNGLPVMMLLLLIPMLADFNENLRKVARFTPNYNMNLLLRKLFNNGDLSDTAFPALAVMLVWILLSVVIFAITYKKVGIDK